MVPMVETAINGRWHLLLPEHRAARPEWPFWEATRLAAMHAAVRPGDVVFDLGAEEGDFPALWASWGADVVLFEPNDRVWPNVRAIFDANHLGDRVLRTWSGFAGSEDVTLGQAPGGAGEWPDSASGPVIGDHGFCNLWERPDIPAIRLDTFTESTGVAPTVITVDVEGAELAVLSGAEAILEVHRPVVFVSVHPQFMADGYGHDPEDLMELFASRGYWHRWLCTDHEEHHVWQHPENARLPLELFQ